MATSFICPDETPPTNWVSLTGGPREYQINGDTIFLAEIYGEFMNPSDELSFTGKVFFVNKGPYVDANTYSALPNIVMVRTMLTNLNGDIPAVFAEQCFTQCLDDATLNGIVAYPTPLAFNFPF